MIVIELVSRGKGEETIVDTSVQCSESYMVILDLIRRKVLTRVKADLGCSEILQ